MMAEEIGLEQIAELALNEGKKAGCSDVSVIGAKSVDSQVRFSNNEITLVNTVRNLTLDVYLAKDRKRIVGSTYNPSERGIRKFIDNLASSCASLPASEEYAELPKGPFKYQGGANFDPKVETAPLVDYVKQTIDTALQAGAKRVSGSLNTECTDLMILTSGAARGKDRQSKLLLNVRAFADDLASGHGLSCTSYVSDFKPEEAGVTAGSYAKRALNPQQIAEGTYDVLFTSTVVANILPVAAAASAFAMESGSSFLEGRKDQQVGSKLLSIEDFGVYERGLGGRIFDDEGTPTSKNPIVREGYFRTILHNSTTAKKANVKSTGSAGIIVPHPMTIVFDAGSLSFDEMIKETGKGLLITNNWYTRYQNQRTGEYSTVPRDAAFLIEGGEIKGPVAGLRVSDSIPRQLSNIALVSKEREWIKWWEVETPTLAPSMMIRGVQITRAVGS